jgi:enoyl-CoA hydratase/carnithine racemase
MGYETITFEVEDRVATVTLHRPERMNAFTWQMGEELGDAYATCDADDQIRAVILTGAGKAFCAGADMGGGDQTFRSVEGQVRAREREERRRLAPFQVRKPVIAAINGHAIGAGLTMTMQCDLRLVAEDAKLAFAFVRRGVVPELGSHTIVPRLVGLSNAADLLLSGRTFLGREAAELGLASKALPAAEVLPAAREMALEIAINAAPVSVAISKRLLWEGIASSVPETIRKEATLLAWAGQQPDAAEGVISFLQKRTPEWKLRPSCDMPEWPAGGGKG